MTKTITVCSLLFVLNALTLLAFGESDGLPPDSPPYYIHEKITPGLDYIKTLPDWGGLWFSLPYKPTDNIVVQIVRSSDPYSYERSPVLALCNMNNLKCAYDNRTSKLSFEISGKELSEASNGMFNFVLYGIGAGGDNTTAHGIVVGIMVCINSFTSLATCTTNCYRDCDNGKKSDVLNACVCLKGFTGPECQYGTHEPPTLKSDNGCGSNDCSLVIIVIIINYALSLTVIAVCVHVYVKRLKMKIAQQAKDTPAVPPPPPAGYAYHPLNVAPPPAQCGIEIPTLPENGNSVYYIQPAAPAAPATNVPVFVHPPVKK